MAVNINLAEGYNISHDYIIVFIKLHRYSGSTTRRDYRKFSCRISHFKQMLAN